MECELIQTRDSKGQNEVPLDITACHRNVLHYIKDEAHWKHIQRLYGNEVVEKLLPGMLIQSSKERCWKTPLYSACRYKRRHAEDLLIDLGKGCDRLGIARALTNAVTHLDDEQVIWLLANGAKLQPQEPYGTQKFMEEAGAKIEADLIRYLINIDFPDKLGSTYFFPLLIAIHQKQTAILDLLLKLTEGHLPEERKLAIELLLYPAVVFERTQAVEVLVKYGGSFNFTDPKWEGVAPIDFAESPEIRALLQNAQSE